MTLGKSNHMIRNLPLESLTTCSL